MMKSIFKILCLCLTASVSTAQSLPFELAHTHSTGIYHDAGTKVIAFDNNSKRLFSTNVSQTEVTIIDYTDVFKPFVVTSIDVSNFSNRVRGVAAHSGIIAIVGDGNSPQFPGKLLLYDKDGKYLRQFSVGTTPDMVGFSPDGNKILVANEGIPDSTYSTDPLGSVSILDIAPGISFISQSDVKQVTFEALDSVPYDPLIHVHGPDSAQSPSHDLEPEHITANSSSTKAYVVLQENNALAIIDIPSASLDTVMGLGHKRYSLSGLDASDVNQQINIRTYNRLLGMYQPDGIIGFEHNGNTYLATANEGAAREYAGYNEVRRVNNLPLDPSKFSNLFSLLSDTVLGRLKVSKAIGDNNEDGIYDSLFTFGGRSFSIWDENGQLVWDSEDEFEQTLAALHSSEFNSDYDDNSSYKTRSDDRGPEPEAVAVGEVDSIHYAFISLKRMGGIMIYDISDPTDPQFVMYELNRDFSKPASDPGAGDLGPSSLAFVPASSTTLGIAQLYVANEISGTISVYQAGMGIGVKEYPMEEPGLYPNPSSGVFHADRYRDFKVYNTAGQLIKTVQDQNHIDLSDQPEGYYIIRNDEGRAMRVIKK